MNLRLAQLVLCLTFQIKEVLTCSPTSINFSAYPSWHGATIILDKEDKKVYNYPFDGSIVLYPENCTSEIAFYLNVKPEGAESLANYFFSDSVDGTLTIDLSQAIIQNDRKENYQIEYFAYLTTDPGIRIKVASFTVVLNLTPKNSRLIDKQLGNDVPQKRKLLPTAECIAENTIFQLTPTFQLSYTYNSPRKRIYVPNATIVQSSVCLETDIVYSQISITPQATEWVRYVPGDHYIVIYNTLDIGAQTISVTIRAQIPSKSQFADFTLTVIGTPAQCTLSGRALQVHAATTTVQFSQQWFENNVSHTLPDGIFSVSGYSSCKEADILSYEWVGLNVDCPTCAITQVGTSKTLVINVDPPFLTQTYFIGTIKAHIQFKVSGTFPTNNEAALNFDKDYLVQRFSMKYQIEGYNNGLFLLNCQQEVYKCTDPANSLEYSFSIGEDGQSFEINGSTYRLTQHKAYPDRFYYEGNVNSGIYFDFKDTIFGDDSTHSVEKTFQIGFLADCKLSDETIAFDAQLYPPLNWWFYVIPNQRIYQYWGGIPWYYQPPGSNFYQIRIPPHQVTSTGDQIYKVCAQKDVQYQVEWSYSRPAGSQTDLTLEANFDINSFFRTWDRTFQVNGVRYRLVNLNYSKDRIYDTADFTITYTQSITTQSGKFTSDPVSVVLQIGPPPCNLSPDVVKIEAVINSLPINYNVGGERMQITFPEYTMEPTFSCNSTYIRYSYRVSPINRNSEFITFDPNTRTFSWYTENQDDEGFWDIDLIGYIEKVWQSYIYNEATFQLVIYHKCNNPATVLTGLPENEEFEFTFRAGLEDTVTLIYFLQFSDSVDNTCWADDWSYALFNNNDELDIIEITRDQTDQIQYSFDPQERKFEFFAQEDAPSRLFEFRIEVYRRNKEKLTEIPLKVILVDQKTSLLENLAPNQYSPMFEKGDSFNNTVINIKELEASYIDLGKSYDLDNDEFSISFNIQPMTPYITFNQQSSFILLKFIELFSEAEESDQSFDIRLLITDKNLLPRQSIYFFKILVPMTQIEEAQENENYQYELSEKYEQAIKKQIVKPGEIDSVQISDTGVLKLVFTEPLPDSVQPEEIAKDFIIIKLVSNTEVDPEKQKFELVITEASRTEIVYLIKFENPLFISSETKFNLDQLEITMLKPLFQEIVTPIPKQAADQQKAQQLASLSNSVEVGSTSILATTLVANFLLRASISQLWGMINAIQIIAYLTFLNVYFPQNVSVFFEFLIDLSNFDIIPLDEVANTIFPFLDEVSTKALNDNRRLAKKGGGGSKNRSDLDEAEEEEEEKSLRIEAIKSQLGYILLVLVLISILIPLLCFLWTFKHLNLKVKHVFNTVFYAIFFNQSARFILESYTPLMQEKVELLNEGLLWKSNFLVYFLNYENIIFTVFYLLFPLVVTVYFYNRLQEFKTRWFIRYWGEIMANLSWRRRSSSFFIIIFCYRRLISALLVVLVDQTVWAQICLNVLLNQTVVILLGLSSPFKFKSELVLEFVNEVNIMFCSYHLFLFTEFVPDPNTRFSVGMSMIFFTTANLVINLGLMIYSTLKQGLKRMRLKSIRYQKMQKVKIRQSTGISVPINKEELNCVIEKNLDQIDIKTKPYITSVHHKLAPYIDKPLHLQLIEEEERRQFDEQSEIAQARVQQIKEEWLRQAREKKDEELQKISEESQHSYLSISSESMQSHKQTKREKPPQRPQLRQVVKEEAKRELTQNKVGLFSDTGLLVTLDNLQGYDKDLVFNLYLQREREGIPYPYFDIQQENSQQTGRHF